MGGAIYCERGIAYFKGITFLGNTVKGGTPGIGYSTSASFNAGTGAIGAGGAMYMSNSILVLDDSLLTSNGAIGGGTLEGGPLVFQGFPAGAGLGGAAFLSVGSTGIVRSTSFDANSCTGGNGGKFFVSGAGNGGAVFSAGDLRIFSASFSNNVCVGGTLSASTGSGQGGAVCAIGGLAIQNCAIVENYAIGGATLVSQAPLNPGAGEGGGLWSSGSLTITNSTLTANHAVGGGEAFYVAGGPGGPGRGGGLCITGGSAILINTTIAANRADPGTNWLTGRPEGFAGGGGLFSTNGTASLRNSIVANSANGGDVMGIISDAGYNICSDATAGFSGMGSANDTDPKLGPIGDYGGPTATMPLLAGSPAIDAGGLAGAPSTDQRGRARPFGPAVDIGAFESSPPYILAGSVYGFTLADEVSVSTPTLTNTTTDLGHFRFDGFVSGTYSLSAAHTNYVFVPSSQEVIVGPDKLDLTFHAFRWHDLSPEPITNGLSHLVLAATPGTTWRILTSTNTQDWTAVSTNTVGLNSILDCLLPRSPVPSKLYRAVTP